ncbi:MAG TPA: FG-GAP-like repeat-containing protein [Bacteroidales bacterium]|nr:FG-GAP-like repeat-containing protein [Bacteroidales bacterium]
MDKKVFHREGLFLLLFLIFTEAFSQTFTDVTPANMIPETQSPEPFSTSRVFWVDIDNDSDFDLFFLEEIYGKSQLFRNEGAGSFTKLTAPFYVGQASAFGDIDRDGYIDIIMSGNHPKIYLNNDGDGTFHDIDDDGTADNDRIPYNLDGQPIDLGDFDNDGDLDIIFGSSIFRTNNDLSFTWMESISLIAVNNGGAVKWADFNNDGFLDIFMTGESAEGKFAKIYRNLGNSSYEEVPDLSPEGLSYASVDVGDYDADGDKDLIITGFNKNSLTRIYIIRNEGNWAFTILSDLQLQPVWRGCAQWGDIDKDNDLDIILVGWTNSFSGPFTGIYKNLGNSSFSLHSFCPGTDPLYPTCIEQQIGSGRAAWGDYDNDGDLDFALIGSTNTGITEKLYRNNSDTPNDAPDPPTGTASSVNKSDVTLSWNPVTNDETPPSVLTYNIKIGTTNNGSEIMPANSNSSGYRNIVEQGNSGTGTYHLLKKLPFGTYHWRVQAIDYGFAGGEFSSDNTFTVIPVQASSLSAKIIDPYNLLLKWERGNGDKCIVFCKQATGVTALPADGTTYLADNEFGYGDQIDTEGWYCVYNGRNDSVAVKGLLPGKLYSFHIFEYKGSAGTEDYWTDLSVDGNPGIFSTNMFPAQTNITVDRGTYNKAVWGDFNNDSYIDFLVPGNPTLIYENNKVNNFIKRTDITLPSIEAGSAEWGDYNNDSYLDIIVSGTIYGTYTPLTKIYLNNNGASFSDQGQLSVQVCMSSVAWGDYDNDGDLDIILNGSTTVPDSYIYWYPGTPITKIFTNNGDNSFTELAGTTFTGLSKGYVRWGDIDNDGDLDVAITGFTDLHVNKTEIYANKGNNTFELKYEMTTPGSRVSFISLGDYDNDNDMDMLYSNQAGAQLFENLNNFNFQQKLKIDVASSSEACWAGWADFDNDGYTDIIFSNPGYYTKLYRNTHGIQEPGAISDWFILTYSDLLKSSNGFADWGDYDNDGDLDVLISCYYNDGITNTCSILKNGLIMKSGSFRSNSRPLAPQNITSTITPSGVILTWDPVSGDETIAQTMTYNLKVDNTQTSKNICPPLSLTDGRRLIPETGNSQMGTSSLFKNLPSATYTWKVQAVDQGYMGSEWSSSGTFEVKNVQAFFSASEVCLGMPTVFDDQSVASKGFKSWFWEFGDGTTSTQQEPEHTYATSGTFSVKLTITDTEDATDFQIKSVTVLAKPTVNFTATTVCNGASTPFTNTTNANGLTINVWSWSFGDGHTSTLQNPGSNTYSFAGDYTVSLGAEASNGCTDQISKTVTVAGYPVAAISADGPTSFCSGQSVLLSTPSNAKYTYAWKRDGAIVPGAISNSYTTSISGIYTVAVTNTDAGCLTNSDPVTVTANSSPAAPLISASGPLTFCQGESVNLSAVYNSDYTYKWMLNGGEVGTGANTYTAAASGTYSLTVKNSFNCSTYSSNTVSVTVNSNPAVPTVSISGPTSFCQGSSVELSVSNTGGYSYQWENNSAAITNATASSYIANSSGGYTLKITNSNNCFIRTENVNVFVSESPSAPTITTVGLSTFCQDESILLSVTNTPGYSYQWKLNSGDVGSGSNTYTANASGTYNLLVTNASNCSVSSSNSIAVTVNPKPALPTVNISGPTSFCQGGNVELSVASTPGYEYQWENSGSGITGAIFNSYSATSSGNYILRITNSYGCSTKTENVAVTVATSPAAPLIVAAGSQIFCQGDSVELSISPTSGYNYQWKLNGGTIGANNHLLNAKSAGTYSLTVANSIGCSANSTNTVDISVKTKPSLPTVNLSGPTSFCQGSSVDLSVNSSAGYQYEWENNGAAISGASSNKLTAYASGVYAIKITNSDNCFVRSENVTVNVLTVPSPPSISSASAITFCQGDSVILSVTNTPDYSYQWRLNGGSVGSNSYSYSAKTSGSYDIVVENSSKCTAASISAVQVTVKPLPVLSTIRLKGDSRFCNGGSATLSVPVNNSYYYSWKKGSTDLGHTSNSIEVKETGLYFVELTLDGCPANEEPVLIEVIPKPARPDINMGSYNKNNKCLGENPLVLAVDNIVQGYTYLWHKNETPLSDKTSIEVTESANYYLEAISDICSSERDTAVITFDEALPKPDIFVKGPVVWMLSTAAKASMYKWYYNGLTIPGATNNTYIAGQNMGTYRVAISNDGECFYFSDNKTIPDITGIEDTDPFENVKIYPNPTTGMFTIEMNNNIFGELAIDIFTQNGSKALNIKFEKSTEHFRSQIDLSGQSKGMYLLNLYLDKYRAVKKVVVE